MTETSTGQIVFLQFIFLITGVGQTVLVNLVSYHGAASQTTMLPVLFSYLAMAVVYFIPEGSKSSSNTTGSHDTKHKQRLKKIRMKHRLQSTKQGINNTKTQNWTDRIFSKSFLFQRYFEKYSRSNSLVNNDLRLLLNENEVSHTDSLLKEKSLGSSAKINNMRKYDSRIQYLALYDVLCTVTSFVALVTAGSGTYQLVYSSIIIITATFRHFLLPNKKLSLQQWLACLVVTLGLLLSAMGNHRFVSNDPNNPDIANIAAAGADATKGNGKGIMQQPTALHAHTWTEYFAGFSTILLPLLATVFYSYEYVLVEKLMESEHAPSAKQVCYKIGMYGTCISSSYILFNVLPNWDELVINEIIKHDGDWSTIFLGYFFIFLCYFGHNWTYFDLLHVSGAVSTGINQALRAVFVFVISAICFCQLQESQCFNSYKLLSLVVVTTGVMRYAYVSAMANEKVREKTKLRKAQNMLMTQAQIVSTSDNT